MSAVQIALQHNQNSARGKNSKTMSGEASPDSKCPICLDRFNNISHLDRCLHKFCFRCILEWSKNKAECPLCKQPFRSIYHNVKSDQDFQRYELKQQVDNASFGYFEGVRFRYRTTFTGIRATRRTSPPPDNGVMFEASSHPPPEQHRDRYIRRMMMRLEAKRQAAREGRAVNNVREQEMINFRRELYRRGERVQSVKDGGRSRNTSAEFYRRNPACLHRLVPWLKRELMVLYGAHGSLVNIVQHIIMSRITRYDMEDGAIHGELRPFLQGRTGHFLHEFISFAKSPFNMEAYDQHAVYDCPAPSENEGSSSNSSVIEISEDEETFAEVDTPGEPTSTLSHSLWDDETPGPSYSTSAEQRETKTLTPLNLDSDISSEEEMQEFEASPHRRSAHNPADVPQSDCNDEDCVHSDGEDCVIVGFVKPTAERTPELVHLSSNSSESEMEDTEEALLPSHHIRFTSCSPAASNRSGSVRVEQIPETDHHRQLDSKERYSTSRRHKTSKKSNSKEKNRRYESKERVKDRHKPKDREDKRRGNSKSRERRHSSRSPENSNSSLSSQSAETDYSYSRGRDFSKCGSVFRRKDKDHSYQSYSHYKRDRNGSVTRYTHRQSYYYSSHKNPRSRSRSRSRDLQRRHKRWSRSRSCSSSRSLSTKHKSHHNKPGGKRKNKTRHLEDSSKDLQDAHDDGGSALSTKHKKKSKERHHKTSRKSSCSVEDARNGEEHDQNKHHHKKKKHKKAKRHKHAALKSKSSLAVITIDTDSDSSSRLSTSAKNIFTDDEQASPQAED